MKNIKSKNKDGFRDEAIKFNCEKWLGPSRISLPSSVNVVIFTIVMIFLIILTFLFLGKYEQHFNISGKIIYDPPAINIYAQKKGTLEFSAAFEGKLIAKGEVLFAINSDTSTIIGDVNFEKISLMKEQLYIYSHKLKDLKKEFEVEEKKLKEQIFSKEHQLDLQEKIFTNLIIQNEWFRDKLQEYEALRKKGMILDSEIIERKKDLYFSTINKSNSELTIATVSAEILQLKQVKNSLAKYYDNKNDNLTLELSNLEQKIIDAEENKGYLIFAPFDGKISAVTISIGENIEPGKELAVLVPIDAKVKVELLATSESLGQIVNGSHVKLRIAAFPYQWYGKVVGVIENISLAPVNKTNNSIYKYIKNEKDLFRLIITPTLADNQAGFILLPGMDVETEVYIKSRNIYEWIFIP